MKRLLLVVNPSASSFTGERLRRVQAGISGVHEVTTVWPASPEESTEAAAFGAKEGFDVVVAMGGDGTVHHVANGLVGTESALGIVPSGTTNVIGRLLGIKRKNAAAVLGVGNERSLQVARVTIDGSPRANYGIFAVGAGYDAEVLQAADRQPASKLSFGSLHYARNAFNVLWSGFRDRHPTLRAKAHGRHADGVAVSVQVQTSYSYLGPLSLPLGPKRSEGFTVLTARNLDLWAATRLGLRIATRRTAGTSNGELWSGVDDLMITAEPDALVQIDGELMGRASLITVSPASEGLTVIAPPFKV
ncbi:MAG: diacylglycerol kinase family protein [Acidimicrobiia bacterium]|nr:diacylglycerol kinase family protein [Acidimicrobiia bacterium]